DDVITDEELITQFQEFWLECLSMLIKLIDHINRTIEGTSSLHSSHSECYQWLYSIMDKWIDFARSLETEQQYKVFTKFRDDHLYNEHLARSTKLMLLEQAFDWFLVRGAQPLLDEIVKIFSVTKKLILDEYIDLLKTENW